MLTVLTPAASHRLTTLASAKIELDVSSSDADLFLVSAIDQASDAVRAWCGRTLAVESVREVFDGRSRADGLLLSRWPVLSIEAVTIAGVAFSPILFEADASGALYRLDGLGHRIGWLSGRVAVDYTAGYVLPGETGRILPADIERAALLLVKGAYHARSRDPLVRSEEVAGVGSTSYGLGGVDRGFSLSPEVEGLLSRHRVPSVG